MRCQSMKWLLVVFVTSPIGDPAPTAIFQTAISSETLCEAAATDLMETFGEIKIGIAKVSAVCLLITTRDE